MGCLEMSTMEGSVLSETGITLLRQCPTLREFLAVRVKNMTG